MEKMFIFCRLCGKPQTFVTSHATKSDTRNEYKQKYIARTYVSPNSLSHKIEKSKENQRNESEISHSILRKAMQTDCKQTDTDRPIKLVSFVMLHKFVLMMELQKMAFSRPIPHPFSQFSFLFSRQLSFLLNCTFSCFCSQAKNIRSRIAATRSDPSRLNKCIR